MATKREAAKGKKPEAKPAPARKATPKPAPEAAPAVEETKECTTVADEVQVGVAPNVMDALADINTVLQLDPPFEITDSTVSFQGKELDMDLVKEALKSIVPLIEIGDVKPPEGATGLKPETVVTVTELGFELPGVAKPKKAGKAKADKPKKEKAAKTPKAEVEKDKFGFRKDSIKHTVADMIESAGKKGVTVKDIVDAAWNTRKNNYKSYWMELIALGHAEMKEDRIYIKK